MSPSELERLYDDHASALFALILNLTRDEADTQDILQEVFSRLVTRPDVMKDVRDERSYLLRMAHRLALDGFRRREVRSRNHAVVAAECVDLFAPTFDPDESAFRRELARALSQLPMDQRAVVHLKLWEGLTFEAISSALEIPANTAASRYRYGIDKLQGLLRPFYDEIRTR